MKTALKIVLPPTVVVLAGLIAWGFVQSRPVVETRVPEPALPVVEVVPMEFRDVKLNVRSQGTVRVSEEMVLSTEVPGRVAHLSSALSVGGFFDAGELLLRIDPRDYELAVAQAETHLVQNQARLQREESEALVARREWEELGRGEPTPLALREPQLAEARAQVRAAEAALEMARLELSRTEIRAPFNGRVRTRNAAAGQFVARGEVVARLYSIDRFEIELLLPDWELAFVSIPLGFVTGGSSIGPLVAIRAEFAGRQQHWSGRVIRTGAEIDPRSRLVPVIVEVEDPYGTSQDRQRTPLAVGMFVEAEILGHAVREVFELPRSAIYRGNQVLVLEDQDRLRFRAVEILRFEDQRVLIRSGLMPGEKVCVTPLETPVDGMRVRPAEKDLDVLGDQSSWTD